MPAVLGVSAHYHDAAAALVIDGKLVAAQQEERLSRVKNDPSLPMNAIEACLTLGEIRSTDLDRVVFYENPYRKLERVMVSALRGFPRGTAFFRRALRSQLGDKLWVLDDLAAHLGVPRKRMHFVDHHESHAASALFCAPFGDVPHSSIAALTVDGVGEEETTAIWRLEDGRPRRLASIAYPHSLGLFYAAVTAYCGFRVNEGEFKVMGLAAFGEPRYRDAFDHFLQVEGGAFTLDRAAFADHLDGARAFGRPFVEALGEPRTPAQKWNYRGQRIQGEDARFADVARSAQDALEDALLTLAEHARALTGATHLVLAGGVALNSCANARLLREGPFERVFVQPAAGDAGGALGAALLGAQDEGDALALGEPFCADLGVPIRPATAAAIADALGLRTTAVVDPNETLAARIAGGDVIALARGRCEFGPRALGHRSLLARADDEALRDRINARIKKREPFRPFAPAMLESTAPALLRDAPNDMTPYMTTVCRVRDRSPLQGTTHVDGTARAQTVQSGPLAPLLRCMESHGLHSVLNTSLNGPGEPLAATEADAIDVLIRHKPDGLLIDDLLIERPNR
ncbi:MAG: carbamoyltransferase N-terminal domain-containing protein [Myxococcota bacterium]